MSAAPTPTPPPPSRPARPAPPAGPNPIRLGAAIAIAIVIAVAAYFLFIKDDDDDEGEGGGAEAAQVEDLRGLEEEVGHPVYWAGERPGETYELTRAEGGNIFVRYLSEGADVGVPRPDYLTVGTYPFRRAYAALQRQSRRRGRVSSTIRGGGIVVANSRRAQNAYFAYPREDVQVEVFDPRPGRAFGLIRSGDVVPIR